MSCLVMLIARRHDYHFAAQPRTLAVLPNPGSRNSWIRDKRSHENDLKRRSQMKRKPSGVSINKVVTGRNARQSLCLALARTGLALFAAGALTAAGVEASESDEFNGNEHWVGTWSNAMHEPDLGIPGLANDGFNSQTLRQIVHISVGGRQVRVRLSTLGASGLVIGAAHIALRDTGASTVPASDRVLTFGGASSITIPPGALVVSDPVDLNAPALSDVAVSIFVPGKTGPATWHFEGRQTSFISTPGDFTASVMLPVASTTLARFWLAGVDVVASGQTGTIVAVGESVTDGSQSTVDANARWTDAFARRLLAQPGNRAMGVLNEGIAGGRVLHDSLGPNALARFDRDVLAQTGVTHVIAQVGDNDIFTVNPAEEVTVGQIIQGLRQLIQRAHANGLKIFGCTLTPVEGFLVPGTPVPVFSPAGEIKRQAVNAWIRTSGEYDDVIDFDRVLRDPNSPSKILSLFDSGDHGHPTDAGYKALADAIDLKLFTRGEGRR
jgi:lysophospholipase L1-like esterase